ncbi:transposase family protein [Bacillus thuringiensis serovar morrisoni]|nr:transposase family protein [Bacillus thuringiensis serovar morrisoni]KIP27898.1 transposase family protein [Bacillus thuringiensis serovar morrisoni]
MRLFVGLDVSSFDMKVCFLNGDGEKLDSFSVSNDLPGATTLKEKLLQCIAGKEVDILKIGLESTSVYSFHPSMFLHHDIDLQRFGAKVFLLNPKQVANFKKSYSDMNKTDEIDAFVIADYLRFGRNQMSIVKGKSVRGTAAINKITIPTCQNVNERKTTLSSTPKF